MELWIRSQDSEALTKVNMGVMFWKDVNNRNCIVNKDNATGFSILGAYKTKERALEVLDEIQNILKIKNMYEYDRESVLKGWNNIDADKINEVRQQMSVYEMPRE